MKSVTKKDLIEKILNEGPANSKAEAERMFHGVVDALKSSLLEGQKVQVAGFGIFTVKERKEREGRNPRTGDKITIPASNTVAFRPAKTLKEAVNEKPAKAKKSKKKAAKAK